MNFVCLPCQSNYRDHIISKSTLMYPWKTVLNLPPTSPSTSHLRSSNVCFKINYCTFRFWEVCFTPPAASRLGLSDRRYPEDLEITNISLACYDKTLSTIMKWIIWKTNKMKRFLPCLHLVVFLYQGRWLEIYPN